MFMEKNKSKSVGGLSPKEIAVNVIKECSRLNDEMKKIHKEEEMVGKKCLRLREDMDIRLEELSARIDKMFVLGVLYVLLCSLGVIFFLISRQ